MFSHARVDTDTLTPRQLEVLGYIHRHISREGWPPTIREIAMGFSISSTNGVADHLRAIIRKGYLTKASTRSRGLRLTAKGEAALAPSASQRSGLDVVPVVPYDTRMTVKQAVVPTRVLNTPIDAELYSQLNGLRATRSLSWRQLLEQLLVPAVQLSTGSSVARKAVDR
jgi:DNA-binding MarR family transcriptional regulator